MKIIKAGKLPQTEEIFRGTCSTCGCEIECDDFDKWGEIANKESYLIRCPTPRCVSYITVKKVK